MQERIKKKENSAQDVIKLIISSKKCVNKNEKFTVVVSNLSIGRKEGRKENIM